MSAVTDIRLAARLLLKERWFTLAAASALALASTSAIVARASLLVASVQPGALVASKRCRRCGVEG